MKKRKNQLILSLLSKKTDPYNDENAIDFKWSDVHKEEDEEDLLWLTSLKITKASWWGKFSKN